MMRRIILSIPVVLLGAAPAEAANSTINQALEVSLIQPQADHLYINLDDCEGDAELSMQWRLPSNAAYKNTLGASDGSVFLSTSSTCDSENVPIKSQMNIEPGTGASGSYVDYPPAGETLTVSKAGLSCAGGDEKDYYFCIKFTNVSEVTSIGVVYDVIYKGGSKFRFDVKAPAQPKSVAVLAGDGNVRVRWENASSEDDRAGFTVYYREATSGDAPREATATGGSTTEKQITGLENGTEYEFWVRAYDNTKNRSVESTHVLGTPMPSDDFFEYYKKNGGGEQGGFCFVATAAYGSSSHALVGGLQAFRDSVLLSSAAGRDFVRAYYQYGPRWARAIRGSDFHRALARIWLLPAAGAAWLWRHPAALGLGLLILAGAIAGLFALRRKRRPRAGAVAAVLVLLGLLPSSARAQMPEPQPRFQIQFRFSPYSPDIDSESGLSEKPFKTIFGSTEPLSEFQVDYELWRGFGVVSVGASFGFVQWVGKARVQGASGSAASPDTTVLNLIPLRLTAGYAFDVLAQRFSVPLVPYAAAGLDYGIWWVLDGVGDVAEFQDSEGHSYTARGGIFGYHLAAGMKLLLDILDRDAADELYTNVGIANSYLFAEFCASFINNFGVGDHLNLGDATFVFGLALEF